MSLEILTATGSTSLTLVANLKVAIAASAFQPKLEVAANETDTVTLLDKKSGFTLIEANAIVKYLSNDFSASTVYEETTLHAATKQSSLTAELLTVEFSKAELTAEQIIYFAAAYPVLAKAPTAWFAEFSALPAVTKGVKAALALTTVERTKKENTGAINVQAGVQVNKQATEIIPKVGERNILITSALPYVNNVPHLGNIVGSVLSADIYSRYCKARNYNTLYMCGTDEYGTATETKALEEKVTPRELCAKYHKIHKEVYEWFQIGFDYFGRTTTDKQTEIAQDIFMGLYDNDFLEEQTMKQLYCPVHNGFLADRYVEGICPKCSYEDARGDQCDKCGNLLNPFELIQPRCKLDGTSPEIRESKHIFLSLDKLEPELKEWVLKASTEGNWSKNSKTITNSWLKEGLNPRCITRDLVWGTPVPLKGEFENKVLYVWFDATIGYISITANYSENNWEKWWKNPENVQLYQFMGKDNVPFHTVVFPASQIGTRAEWTMLHHLNTTEYLQYEGGKFSKSRGVGVFGNNAQDTGISASVWRYYLASVRPETSDSQFSWAEFVAKNNNELLANLGNYVNRLVKFVNAKYNGVLPAFDVKNLPNYDVFQKDINELLAQYVTAMEGVQERRGLEIAMAISSRGNQFLQENKLDNSLYSDQPDKSDAVIMVGINLVYILGAIFSPYIPETSRQINDILRTEALRIPDGFILPIQGGHCIGKAQYLFKRIEEKKIDEWRSLYGGAQVK
ncbi:hypothetical protein BABINDRAFT_124611 [Babjeviella inositovora NRRL Y-12698]|uniref:methionine--tRNA ligase n=1 Tax=Babjeviella inositovora NRRL Y-12698 TaxID=984486 RepID=A0A1E3QSB4_9ASCO|nr:uncharacterized protein BABINDRAFT_124611 [Babjeviella inositovora NRRL Y-12698]ODQ80528.1 hypothetical protein BABINDRAFT_124611 [Babjeviella inositovora NRRL Y-12698]